MAEIPIYILSSISGETGVFNHTNSSSISSASLSSNYISSNSVSAGYLILDYDNVPSTDPLSKGAVWRDSNGFLKISSG